MGQGQWAGEYGSVGVAVGMVAVVALFAVVAIRKARRDGATTRDAIRGVVDSLMGR